MPIKGFSNIEEQEIDKVEKVYGIISKCTNLGFENKLIIKNKTKIPYICDKTGIEYHILWGSLRTSIKEKHFIDMDNYIIQESTNGATVEDICKKHDLERKSVIEFFRRNNISYKSRLSPQLTQAQINFIKENYPKYGVRYCLVHLNITRHMLSKCIEQLNIRKHSIFYEEGYTRCYVCRQVKLFKYFSSEYHNNTKYGLCFECAEKSNINRLYLKSLPVEKQRKLTIYSLLRSTVARAKKKNLKHNIDYKWIDENFKDKCPVLNIEYVMCSGTACDASPSVDRINNDLGYTKDNCIIVCRKVNAMKLNGTVAELFKIAYFYEKLIKII